VFLIVGAWVTSPAAALGYSAAPGYAAHDYATAFPSQSDGRGPIGLAFDQVDRLFVIDVANSQLYSFLPGGGQASSATQVSHAPIPGLPAGAAVSFDGRLYATRYGAGDVVELDPSTGTVLRRVASGLQCATAIAADPISGDLFVSQNLCGSTIFRISNFAVGPGTVTPYASVQAVDGIGFGNDGTLYAESAGEIVAISGLTSPHPGTETRLAFVPHADGMAFGLPPGPGGAPYLIVNRLDGVVSRVDLTRSPGVTSDVFTGGSRGDFAAVDSHGCLNVTQSDRTVQITAADGSCNLVPTTPGARSGVAAQLLVGCSGRKVVLMDVHKSHHHVELLGAADHTLIGHRVNIYLAGSSQPVASAVVGSDGFFHATAPVPRRANRARYQVGAGADRSLKVKLIRRIYMTSVVSNRGRVTIRGRVTPPFVRRRTRVTIQRFVTCTRTINVKRVKLRRNGRFRATVRAPSHAQAVIYRAATLVRANRHSRRSQRVSSLPRVVAIG
jgi:hypothetical protein